MSEKRTYEIGLVMAGAVSAGAYTAGVMDYLLQALDDWYRVKGQPGIPDHDVSIKVMTGASAGGMTTAITATELLRRAHDPESVRAEQYASSMYKAWVKRIDISKLLETEDLTGGVIKSLLDCTILDEIAREAIDEKKLPPWQKLPYVDDELKLYLALSNLRGLPYDIDLKGPTGLPHGMRDHADYQYVEIGKDTKPSDWIKLRNAALATGAFPIGLASRLIRRDMREYEERICHDGRDISALLKVRNFDEAYDFVAVDGGMLNNEPIELARSVWERTTLKEKEELKEFEDVIEKRRDSKTQDPLYGLIIIDPFPDQVDLGKNATPADTSIANIIGPIIGALRAQSLFKVEELLQAADERAIDRYLVAPIRYTDTNSLATNAIACGFFAGFGGFLSEKFREHDYHLGRRNCQRFLEKFFVLPIAKAHENGWSIENAYVIRKNEQEYYPIIPIVKGSSSQQEQGKDNVWPVYSRKKKNTLQKQIASRVSALLGIALPFGWARKLIITVLAILLLGLAFAGEYVKVAQTRCDCSILIEGLNNTYILLLQLIFFLAGAALILLQLAHFMIVKKAKTMVFDTFMKHLEEWGIAVK